MAFGRGPSRRSQEREKSTIFKKNLRYLVTIPPNIEHSTPLPIHWGSTNALHTKMNIGFIESTSLALPI